MEKLKRGNDRRAKSALTRLLGIRQINFRVWDRKKEKMVEAKTFTNSTQSSGSRHIIMQFTGIEDDNGNEIYEGDIVKVGDPQEPEHCTTHIVIWGGEYYPAFTLKPGLETTENVFSYLQLAADSYEQFWIAGNAFENPELLDECT